MGEPARKLELAAVPVMDKESLFVSLLTRVMIEAFCPLLRSEILFGQLEAGPFKHTNDYWIDAEVRGDLKGRVGIGIDKATLRSLAFHLGMKTKSGSVDLSKTLVHLHEKFVDALEREFGVEDFHCSFSKGSGLVQGYQLEDGSTHSTLCPVETRWGEVKVFVSLTPATTELLEELANSGKALETRKIRVFSSQLEGLFGVVKHLETLESRLLNGPQVRNRMRSQIRKMKRMVQHMRSEPLDTLFSPARKLVVEIGKQQGKQVKFTSHGTWLFLDKTLLNYLYEPILHLIRNAVDHGIEDPAERERTGKSAVAHIKALVAFNQGMLRLIVSDDGRGVDFGAVRERALSKGILTQEEINEKTNEELAEYVFHPGFSTRKQVDPISGRGLGLDIVRKCVESMDGKVRILSTSKHGTSFEILLPIDDDFAAQKNLVEPTMVEPEKREEEEKAMLLDELAGYFERLSKVLGALQNEQSVRSAYEGYRLVHSIKGVVGFLGWQRVASFCHHFEDILKLASEEKVPLDDSLTRLLVESALRLRDFAEAVKSESIYSLQHVRHLESRMQQVIWATTQNDEKTHLFVGKYHLNAVENFLLPLAKNGSFSVRPEGDFNKAVQLPYGALVQFNGDRRGFAGIFLAEKTFANIIHPYITGTKPELTKEATGPMKRQLWTLTEFANLMGTQFAEACGKAGITLQPAAPLTYFGWGQPMRILGNPTYCYSCELNGNPFYLAGDFRSAQEVAEAIPRKESAYQPQVIIEEARRQCEKHFQHWGLNTLFSETPTQSDLIGFDGGITAIISCKSTQEGMPDSVLFLSYEQSLAQYVHQSFCAGHSRAELQQVDLYDCINETSNIVGGLLVSELEKKKLPLKLSLPSLFIGKAYVANFNRLFIANKVVGTTPQGKFELQILVTDLGE